MDNLEDLEEAVGNEDLESAQSLIKEGKKLVETEREHLRIADKFGWETLDKYIDEEVVEGEEKRKKLERAKSEANRELKQRQAASRPASTRSGYTNRGFRSYDSRSYSSQPSNPAKSSPTCFRCGNTGHYATHCKANGSQRGRRQPVTYPSATTYRR